MRVNPTVTWVTREALETVDLGDGLVVPPGGIVQVLSHAAGTDPAAMPDPSFDITAQRPPAPRLRRRRPPLPRPLRRPHRHGRRPAPARPPDARRRPRRPRLLAAGLGQHRRAGLPDPLQADGVGPCNALLLAHLRPPTGVGRCCNSALHGRRRSSRLPRVGATVGKDSRMGFMDQVKAAANDLKDSVEGSLATGNSARDVERHYRDLGMLTYLQDTGRAIDAGRPRADPGRPPRGRGRRRDDGVHAADRAPPPAATAADRSGAAVRRAAARRPHRRRAPPPPPPPRPAAPGEAAAAASARPHRLTGSVAPVRDFAAPTPPPGRRTADSLRGLASPRGLRPPSHGSRLRLYAVLWCTKHQRQSSPGSADCMTGCVVSRKCAARVLVRGGVAAADLAAVEADPQRDPRSPLSTHAWQTSSPATSTTGRSSRSGQVLTGLPEPTRRAQLVALLGGDVEHALLDVEQGQHLRDHVGGDLPELRISSTRRRSASSIATRTRA